MGRIRTLIDGAKGLCKRYNDFSKQYLGYDTLIGSSGVAIQGCCMIGEGLASGDYSKIAVGTTGIAGGIYLARESLNYLPKKQKNSNLNKSKQS